MRSTINLKPFPLSHPFSLHIHQRLIPFESLFISRVGEQWVLELEKERIQLETHTRSKRSEFYIMFFSSRIPTYTRTFAHTFRIGSRYLPKDMINTLHRTLIHFYNIAYWVTRKSVLICYYPSNQNKIVSGYNPDRIRVEKRLESDYPILYPDSIPIRRLSAIIT